SKKKGKGKKEKGAVPGTRTRVVCVQLPDPPPTKVRQNARQHLHGKALHKKLGKINARYNNQLSSNASMRVLDASIADAQANGYKLRPSQAATPLSQTDAEQLRSYDLKLLKNCKYTSIQAAVNDSGNNSRVEILPGTYTEPASRAKPTNDPSCASLR